MSNKCEWFVFMAPIDGSYVAYSPRTFLARPTGVVYHSIALLRGKDGLWLLIGIPTPTL